MTYPYFEMSDLQFCLKSKKFVNLGEKYFPIDYIKSGQR